MAPIVAVAGGGGGGGGYNNSLTVNIAGFGNLSNGVYNTAGMPATSVILTGGAAGGADNKDGNPVLNGYPQPLLGAANGSAGAQMGTFIATGTRGGAGFRGIVSCGYPGGDPNLAKQQASPGNMASSANGGGGGWYNATGGGGSAAYYPPWGSTGGGYGGGGGGGWYGGGGGGQGAGIYNNTYNGGGGGGASYLRSDVQPLNPLMISFLSPFSASVWRYEQRYATGYGTIGNVATLGTIDITSHISGVGGGDTNYYNSGLRGFCYIKYLGPRDPATVTDIGFGFWPF